MKLIIYQKYHHHHMIMTIFLDQIDLEDVIDMMFLYTFVDQLNFFRIKLIVIKENDISKFNSKIEIFKVFQSVLSDMNQEWIQTIQHLGEKDNEQK